MMRFRIGNTNVRVHALALLMLATLVLPALSRAFADDETPAEKVERLRKEISALHEQIKDSEASEKNAQQTKLYYQQLSNTLSAQLAALQEDIEVRKSDLEKKNLAIAQAAEELEAAREAGLPVIIHSREAAADTLEMMKEYGQNLKGIIHCYSYSVEHAREYVKMGYLLGIGGVVTFKNARKLKEVVEEIPLEALVLETDCPYLAPVPNRGKRNSSLNLPLIAEEIAAIKQISCEEVITQTRENARKLFGV